ncbi:DUF3108 domain-containing protein [Saccharospirillum mangrovi]|uniref:DUF3108 domain-containing protein n=1 Tax=Saccharospirillum mangrovi TaxID=2161747 RepID=UPI000D37D4F2|nr:DUF3108 domain-containing protein [Saccharospirillum mangrovi]
MTLSKRLSILVLLALPLITLAETLVPFTARMEVTRYGVVDVHADGELRLQQTDDGNWHYRLFAQARGVQLSEDSWFAVQDSDIRPQRYRAETKVLWSVDRTRLNFDYSGQRITGEADGDRVNLRLTEAVYDPLSYQLVLQQRLKAGERELEFDVFRIDEIDDFAFRVAGEERLRIAGGTVDTWIIDQTEPLLRKERKRIWIAPSLGFVPLRFTREYDGKLREEFRVTSLSINGEPVDFRE